VVAVERNGRVVAAWVEEGRWCSSCSGGAVVARGLGQREQGAAAHDEEEGKKETADEQ
jgi:hypothetical protein